MENQGTQDQDTTPEETTEQDNGRSRREATGRGIMVLGPTMTDK